MRCPYCGAEKDRVVNSRVSTNGNCVRRRRECVSCGKRFTTHERIEGGVLRVVKKDGSREAFSRNKLMDGMLKACHKRPVPTEKIEEAVADIERELHQQYEPEVLSNVIGEMVTDKLKDIDEVAYIRFASVYREFTAVADFVEEAATVFGNNSAKSGRSAKS